MELAQLHYMLPRLAGLWTHLSRQRAGVGARGPGEQQLEVDRRRVQEKIHRLEHALDDVRKNRRVERGGRQRLHWPLVSIIGYTNSGKSTLMNALTGAGVLAEDKLFATLDPTARKLRLPNNQNILISDTVGFCVSCRTILSNRSRPLSKRSWRLICCCMWSMSAIRRRTSRPKRSRLC